MSEKNDEELEKNIEEKIKATKKRHNRIWLGVGAALGVAVIGTGVAIYKIYADNAMSALLYGIVPNPVILNNNRFYIYFGPNQPISEYRNLINEVNAYNMSNEHQTFGKITINGVGIFGNIEDGFKLDEWIAKPEYFYSIDSVEYYTEDTNNTKNGCIKTIEVTSHPIEYIDGQ